MTQAATGQGYSERTVLASARLKIAYLTVDPSDWTARWRCRELSAAGADVTQFAGEIEDRAADLSGEVYRTVTIGRARKRRLGSRMLLMARTWYLALREPSLFSGVDVFLCRNMDMAVIGYVLSIFFGGIRVYEVLDIHEICTRKGVLGSLFRAMDRIVLRASALLVTSSPAFVAQYFSGLGYSGKWVLLENSVRGLPSSDMYWRNHRGTRRPIGRGLPVVIGYVGKLRCRRSASLLIDVAKEMGGSLHVIFAGAAEPDVQEILDSIRGESDFVSVEGPYENPGDLERIYRALHLCWCIDLSDVNNGSWLLPNRLYEGGLFGIPLLAAEDTETGRRVKEEGLGVVLKPPLAESLKTFLCGLTETIYRDFAERVMRVSPGRFLDEGQHLKLIETLRAEHNRRIGP